MDSSAANSHIFQHRRCCNCRAVYPVALTDGPDGKDGDRPGYRDDACGGEQRRVAAEVPDDRGRDEGSDDLLAGVSGY